jgi:hypothetical protein
MKIPLPQRGQPLDVDYLYQIANQVNTLTNQVSNTSTALSTVDNGVPTIGRKDVTTNNLRVFAKTKSIRVGNISGGSSEPWFEDFSPEFLYAPIVTATPVNNTASSAGNDIIVVIKNITTGRVDGNILYKTSGTIDININIVAIGISR